jgi:hypothetical protein
MYIIVQNKITTTTTTTTIYCITKMAVTYWAETSRIYTIEFTSALLQNCDQT